MAKIKIKTPVYGEDMNFENLRIKEKS